MTNAKLIFFFDGLCPLCLAEVRQLEKLDTDNKIRMVDVYSEQFESFSQRIDKLAALKKLHGLTDKGQLLVGLDVTYRAWHLVGKGLWFSPINWPWLRPFLDLAYRFFAQHRASISLLLTGKRHCETCQSSNPKAKMLSSKDPKETL
ncbi:DUF393 domain-containing protein [Saccharobesus litoralis]|uniref:DUF393 domain-containing protein n=1 Tax=Saccharobesus litoralis TaxID=2172099 RepID=A0A2S0VWC5_9ALTE|nr:DUF393 domain-containing protein [Saccharobesus litoralis]AWB68495.1 DUF393 domain-containing protein [Saccharobesus litoralis]